MIQRPGAEVLPETDKGRFIVTRTPGDDYVFRASPLRNIALTAPYFHSGQVRDLRQAVAIMGTAQLGQELNKAQVERIVAFLESLTGTPPMVVYPILPPEIGRASCRERV